MSLNPKFNGIFRPRKHKVPRRELVLNLLMAAVWWVSSDIGSATTLNKQFIDLLNGDARIRYFKVGFPGDLFVVNDKSINGTVYYEGSIQQNTFWIRNCTNSPPLSGQILPGWIIGLSRKEYWTYRDDAMALAPLESTVASPLNGRAQQVCAWVYKGLGMGVMLRPGTFKIGPNNTFQAVPEGAREGETISGRFEVGSNGYPTRCEYEMSGFPNAKGVVLYDYSEKTENHGMPDHIRTSTSKLMGLAESKETEYQISACDFGEVSLPPEGYTVDFMTNFGGVNLGVRDIVGTTVYQDGLTYRKGRDGKLKLVSMILAQSDQHTTGRRNIVFVLLGIITIVPLWLFARAKVVTLRERAKNE